MADFDHQWGYIPDDNIIFSKERIGELLAFTQLPREFFKGKRCLDAGCGNGRYTYAMLQLGGVVSSIDISTKAIESVTHINRDARVQDLLTLEPNPIHDFVLSWGVLHHTGDPREGFRRLVSQVRPGGVLHVMLYHQDQQEMYRFGRRIWRFLPYIGRAAYIRYCIRKWGGTFHGWWDALNPTYNFSYHEDEIRGWFVDEGFNNILLTQKYNINLQGTKTD